MIYCKTSLNGCFNTVSGLS